MKRITEEPTNREPKELDLDLTHMRAQAERELFDSLLPALLPVIAKYVRQCADIDALDRIVQAQTSEIATKAALEHSTNGRNGNTPVPLFDPRQSDLRQPRSSKPGRRFFNSGRKIPSPRLNRPRLAEAALPYVRTHPGAPTMDVLRFLKSLGMIPKNMTEQSAATALRGALGISPSFRVEKDSPGHGASQHWFLTGKPHSAPAKPIRAKQTVPYGSKFGGLDEILLLKINKGGQHSLRSLTQHARENGMPERTKNEMLSTRVAGTLRRWAASKRLIRREVGSDIFYSTPGPGKGPTRKLPSPVSAVKVKAAVKAAVKAFETRNTVNEESMTDVVKRTVNNGPDEGMTPMQVTTAMIDGGYVFSLNSKNPPRARVVWTLNALAQGHRLKKIGSGPTALYAPTRPNVTITTPNRSEPESASESEE